tara:strand:+ start:6740 stop:6985 length:246 start_codon:yes stop_codon:yes gene_type:complete
MNHWAILVKEPTEGSIVCFGEFPTQEAAEMFYNTFLAIWCEGSLEVSYVPLNTVARLNDDGDSYTFDLELILPQGENPILH